MSLTPATTDKFLKVGNPGTATTLSAPGYTNGVSTSINVGSTTNWPPDTLTAFAIDRAEIVNGVEQRVAGTYCEFVGIVSSATAIGNVSKTFGTGQDYPAGSLTRVYIPVTGTQNDYMVDGLNQDHNGKGNHKTLTDDSSNEWLGRTAVASAVNYVDISNSATGSAVVIQAKGDDTNVGLQIKSKGNKDVEMIPGTGGNAKVDGSVPKAFFALYDFVESGCVITADSAGTNKNYSITSGFVWLAGKRLTVASVAAQTVGASKDRYIDLHDNGDGTAVYVTNEVANNAASQALTAGNLRLGIVVAGATTIATAASINQGQETSVLPIASSIPYAVTDSLGNLICPRDPNRKLLGYRQILTTFGTSSTSAVQVTGLSCPVIVPTGRKVKVSAFTVAVDNNTATNPGILSLWEGTVGSGTNINQANSKSSSGGGNFGFVEGLSTPSSSSKTYNLGLHVGAGSGILNGGAGFPAFIKVELE